MGALSKVKVKDNGDGIPYEECKQSFGKLGESKKIKNRYTKKNRACHGQYGKGRFKAYGIGNKVVWISRYKKDDDIMEYKIIGQKLTMKSFDIEDEKKSTTNKCGVEVTISDITETHNALTATDKAILDLSGRLALYLKNYPGITIKYDGKLIDPGLIELESQSYPIKITDQELHEHDAELTVIEWLVPMERALYLCDEDGNTIDERPPGIQARGFNFTAYLKSPLIKKLADDAFGIESQHPTILELLEKTKEQLRSHFRAKEASRTNELVKQWRKEEVYPYPVSPINPVAKVEQEVFDACAFKVHEYLPGFENAELMSKRLTFRLLKEALENNADSLHAILKHVLELPIEQQDELAVILNRTKLSSLIKAAKTVMNRLDFLASMDSLIFGDFKHTLLERKQLHRILALELWIFGDQYVMGIDDESLGSLLSKHIKIMNRETLANDCEPVTDLDGANGIIDLMLHKRIPQSTPNAFEHLIIELKRPACVLGQEELGQIKKYAFAVADDERFDKKNTRWTFLLIGNKLDSYAQHECNVQGREYGNIYTSSDGAINIHCKKWAEIISDSKWRHEFFREQLELQATKEDGLAFLGSKHSASLPKVKKKK